MTKEILVKPVITEKSFNLAGLTKYVFQVGKEANKIEIKKAVEDKYKVNVLSVHIVWKKPKTRRIKKEQMIVPGRKTAIVTLKKGQKIELFEETKWQSFQKKDGDY